MDYCKINTQNDTLLQVNHLTAVFKTKNQQHKALNDISLRLFVGETLAIIGESGCGKTTLCKAIAQLSPPSFHVVSGNVFIQNVDVSTLNFSQLQKLRGKKFSYIFQNPFDSLNPSFSIGKQLEQTFSLHFTGSKQFIKNECLKLLLQVGLNKACYNAHPFELSGGMLQRVAIALAVMGNPKFIIADEPTSSLDNDTQNAILSLFNQLQLKNKTSFLLVTHDLSIVQNNAHRVAVMYDGEIVELGLTHEVFHSPQHSYTQALIEHFNTPLSCSTAVGKSRHYHPAFLGQPFIKVTDTHAFRKWQ